MNMIKSKDEKNTVKKSVLLKITGVFVLTALMSGCSADDVEDFFDLTPAVRTPPNNVSAVPITAPDIDKKTAAAQAEAETEAYTLTEKEPADIEKSDIGNLFEKPDISSFADYPNMWVEKYIGEYEKKDKTAYLTFDDGPSKNTEEILRVLKENNIKATFFVTPNESEECARRLRAIAAAGHTIGIHSFTHNYLTVYESEKAFEKDFAQAYDIVVRAVNQKPWLYRFPGGSVNQYNRHCRDEIKAALGERGFVYYDWNVDSNDWRGLAAEELCRSVTADAKRFPSPTILMHDTNIRENTVAALENVIKCLKESGYKFAPITWQVEPVQYGVNY